MGNRILWLEDKITMPGQTKYEQILDALQFLLESKDIHKMSFKEIEQTPGNGKGTIY